MVTIFINLPYIIYHSPISCRYCIDKVCHPRYIYHIFLTFLQIYLILLKLNNFYFKFVLFFFFELSWLIVDRNTGWKKGGKNENLGIINSSEEWHSWFWMGANNISKNKNEKNSGKQKNAVTFCSSTVIKMFNSVCIVQIH